MEISVELSTLFDGCPSKPSQYTYSTETQLSRPEPDFVMTNDAEGKILSVYRDNTYNYEAYSTSSRSSKIIFENNIPTYLIEDAKWLFFLIERVRGGKAMSGNHLSVITLRTYLMGAIKGICHFADKRKTTVFEVLENEVLLSRCINDNLHNNNFIKTIIPFCVSLNSIGAEQLGFIAKLSNQAKERVLNAMAKYSATVEQTALIPPRLYGNFLNSLWAAFYEYKEIEIPLLKLINKIEYVYSFSKKKTDERLTRNKKRQIFAQELEDKRLNTLAQKYNWYSNNGGFDSRKVLTYLTNFQQVSKYLIHFYSGMREDEALQLPLHCLQKTEDLHRSYARLIGYTYKYEGFKNIGQWVTTSELEPVILSLQKLAEIFAKYTSASTAKILKKGERLCPLFLSSAYLLNTKNIQKEKPFGSPTKFTRPIISNPLLDVSNLRISSEDISYLEELEPERDWAGEKYKIGQFWSFETHQLRRSLAVYSQQSGLVSIGALQTQLHHLFSETSYYYSNNAENCTFIISKKDHASEVFAREKAFADFSAYLIDLIFSDEPLHGAHGNFIENNVKSKIDSISDWILTNRKETETKFKKGLIAHKVTALGSCSSTEKCNERLLGAISVCEGCNWATIKLSKVEEAINQQKKFISKIGIESVEYRTEKKELDALQGIKRKIS